MKLKSLIIFVTLLITLVSTLVTAQDNSMPAYILVKAQGFDSTDPMTYQAGYPVDVMSIPRLVGKQVPPKYVQVVVTDRNVNDMQSAYCDVWKKEIDWEFVGHDLSIDGHRLRVFMKAEHVSASGLNSITRNQVENFLNRWNASVFSIAQNEVVFDAVIADAIASEGFWGMNVDQAVFTELLYNQQTGIHTTRINYGAIPGAKQNNVAAKIVNNGCTVTVNQPAQNRMTFTCSRDNVFNQFKLDVKSRVDGVFSRKRWYITQEGIDAALQNNGTLQGTQQDLLPYWHNRLLD